jgi:outer membrane protein OmpA-like peptidoglycan-associated protein
MVHAVEQNGRYMQFTQSLCASLLITAALVAPAAAQTTTGDDVVVNSGALGRGYLLYPGGNYARSVRPLLQPGEKPGQVIHLHMPTHHPRVVSSDTPARVASLPAGDAAPRTRIKAAAPVTSDTASLPEDSAARLVGANTAASAPPAKPPVKPARSAVMAPAPTANTGATTVPFSFSGAPVAAPTRTASATPPPRTTASPAAGLKRQTVIPFAGGASSLAPADVNTIHTLAASLTSALSGGASRVELDAFGGPRGDKSSDSRRLSLKRALVVRELLIEDGVPSERIDVRALGGADDSGAPDRVDVFLRS